MRVQKKGSFFVGMLDDTALEEKDKKALLSLANEDLADELLDMIEEAQAVANPIILFGICGVGASQGESIEVNGVEIHSPLAADKLDGRHRCFPYIGTCGRELEEWSKQYSDDILSEFWADEIKKKYLGRIMLAMRTYVKERYHLAGHTAALNPGSLASWPISGQQEQFAILGGRDFVKEAIGVIYNDSFLMLPSKTGSGILFESEVTYENCQHCPRITCPNRRAEYQGEWA
ncbi:MAG: vitamin B12 dependent methionine synthase [Firmicutes bacterium]|nr:vitamin B12 dependent methionine synthase [Bacillota bacterium]